jgi:hypothetical protein
VADASDPKVSRGRGRSWGRAAVVLILAAALAGSSFLLGQKGPAAAPDARLQPGVSGTWFCPHGGSPGWKAWVVVANPGTDSVRIRLTTFGARGVSARSTFDLGGMRQVERSIPAVQADASTQVEYFGGWVAASTYVLTDGSPAAAGAERCAPSPEPHWYVADANTGSGQTSDLVVMNPFAQDAAVDVVIRTDKRSAIRPGRLTPLVVPAGTSTAIRLNDYVLQAPDEALVTGEVDVRLGRVVAGATTVTDAGLKLEVAAPAPSTRWLLPAAGYLPPSTLALFNPTSRRADLAVSTAVGSSQQVGPGLARVSLPPGGVRVFDVRDSAATGLVVDSTNGVPVVVARRVAGDQGDPATIEGAAAGASAWVVPSIVPPAGGRCLVTIQNAGKTDAVVSLRFIGRGGPLAPGSEESFTLATGRSAVIDLSVAIGTKPVAVLVTARGGTVVAASASYSPGGAGFAATLAEAIPVLG